MNGSVAEVDCLLDGRRKDGKGNGRDTATIRFPDGSMFLVLHTHVPLEEKRLSSRCV